MVMMMTREEDIFECGSFPTVGVPPRQTHKTRIDTTRSVEYDECIEGSRCVQLTRSWW